MSGVDARGNGHVRTKLGTFWWSGRGAFLTHCLCQLNKSLEELLKSGFTFTCIFSFAALLNSKFGLDVLSRTLRHVPSQTRYFSSQQTHSNVKKNKRKDDQPKVVRKDTVMRSATASRQPNRAREQGVNQRRDRPHTYQRLRHQTFLLSGSHCTHQVYVLHPSCWLPHYPRVRFVGFRYVRHTSIH